MEPQEKVTASGLRYTDLQEGTGDEARAGRTVEVHYTGLCRKERLAH